jgi:pimeloyl-ACP methyl ester carboxylesterase
MKQLHGRRIMSYVVIATVTLLVAIAVLVGALVVMSPGRIRPVTDAAGRPIPGSIAEKIHVPINGTQQGMVIRSADPANPVLLFVHGGPGLPEYFLDERMPTGLEKEFTVVWWDQRGAGFSRAAGSSAPESMTVDQLVDDTIAVTDYLRARFGQPKVYLLAHSWGTYIGIRAARRAPDRYHAYIGMAQVAHQIESEKLAYDYALERCRADGDLKTVRRLEESPVTTAAPLPAKWNAMRDGIMHGLGVGTTRRMDSVVTGVFVPSWLSREYTLTEKADLWRGMSSSRGFFWDEFMTVDMRHVAPNLSIPTYFVHGRYDYTASYDLARDYFEKLDAPVKGFYTFDDSAHSPAFEEPERMLRVLREDVLAGRTALADKVTPESAVAP